MHDPKSAALSIALLLLFVAGCGGGGGGGDEELTPGVEVLDQANVPDPPRDSGTSGELARAQTFRVDVTGLLSRIDLVLYEEFLTSGPLLVDIRPTSGGAPVEDDGNVLGAFQVPSGSLTTGPGEWATFDISGLGIQVEDGDRLAIVLRSPGSIGGWNWQGSGSEQYADGSEFVRNPPEGIPEFTSFGTDQGFLTYVTP